MEKLFSLFDDYSIFKLDDMGNFLETKGFWESELVGETFINIVSEEDRKKAAKLFIEALSEGEAKGKIRIKFDDSYGVYDIKLVKIGDFIYGACRKICTEEPSFISDFLGNILMAKEELNELCGKNIFSMVEDRNKLTEIIKTAIENGEYEGKIFINEKEAKVRIKATQQLEFFIEEDFFKMIDRIPDSNNINEVFEKADKALKSILSNYSFRLYDIGEIGEEEEIYYYPISVFGEIVGEIVIHEEIDEIKNNMLKFLVLTVSKSIENLKEPSKILEDFAIYRINVDGNIIYVNKKFEEITGYNLEEIKNRNFGEFAEKREKFFEEIRKGKVENFVTAWKGKKRKIITSEFAWKVDDEIVVMLNDITSQKEREKEWEFYNSTLRHDIFNKNEIALGYIGLIEKTNLTKKQKQFLDKIKDAILDSNKLIENVRKAEEIRKTKEKLSPINIKKVVESICESYEEQFTKENIKVHCSLEESKVFADAFLGEIFSNLIKNAIQHADCKNIKIYGKKEGRYYKINVEDDGRGIEEEHLEKIFEEGWKKSGGGSGLGLYIVKKLMERYGGKIDVESELGKGTKFVLSFRTGGKKKKADFLKIRF
ncbi:MAG TPA: PAS domain S-box protein [Thermoplasmatales archaeon]|nr:PAS domain S-box protein [Thermoplasmatales archaeon]